MFAQYVESLTQAQRKAVAARGNVLVTAGAGTGKTLTLATRCCSLVCEHRVPLEQILIVTFTEAAAAEMRQRIRLLLEAQQAISPGNQFLAEQMALLDSAPISTLHSFCLRLLREHFQDLDLDPQFKVLPQDLLQPVITETLEGVCSQFLDGNTPEDQEFQRWIMLFGNGDPQTIQQLALRIHRYAQSLPHPLGWYNQNLRLHSETTASTWRKWLVLGLSNWRDEWLSELIPHLSHNERIAGVVESLQRLAPEADPIPSPESGRAELPLGLAAQQRRPTDKRLMTLMLGPEAMEATRTLLEEMANLSPTKNRPAASASHQKLLKELASEAEFWLSLLPAGGDNPLDSDWLAVRSGMSMLLRLARDFGKAYGAAKQELGGLDFSDLEQNALKLLWDFSCRQPTPLAEQWQQRFQFVFVDEYQDINAAQDAIIQALSRQGAEANCFLVGDVKQSIYRFRLADPRIFRRRINEWQDPQLGPGTVIPLQHNFRSHENLLAFTNALFRSLMRPETTGTVFAENDVLLPGGSQKPPPGRVSEAPRALLHLLQITSAPENEAPDTGASGTASLPADFEQEDIEARFVAQALLRLKQEQQPIWDRDRFRPADWRDMAILLRAPKGIAEAFAREFSRAGIPLESAVDDFLDSPEVTDLLNLLRLLDNPLQDLPLLAVLRSPLAAFTPDELTEMRIVDPHSAWWTVLRRCHRELPGRDYKIHGQHSIILEARPCWEKIHRFLGRYESWRRLARQVSLVQGLEQILADTGYAEILESGPNASDKLANLNRLIELARDFHARESEGLSHFLSLLETQAGAETTRPAGLPPQTNSVRLLSIHRSKGLEFPVVVVANLGRQFNLRDLSQPVILDEEFGVCPRIYASRDNHRVTYPSLPFWLARKRQTREVLAEEMRLLYVAITRARELLLLTGCLRKNITLAPPNGEGPPGPPPTLTARQILGARSCLDWIVLWLNHWTSPDEWIDPRHGRNDYARWWLHHTVPEPDLPAIKTGSIVDQSAIPSSSDLHGIEELKRRIAWKYPHANATAIPAKTSFSRLRQIMDPGMAETTTGTSFLAWANRDDSENGRETAGPLETGIAHHTFLEWISLAQTATLEQLRGEGERMEKAGILTPAEHALLDWAALAGFWESDLGRRVADRAAWIQRELAFTARFTADELAGVGLNINGPPGPDEFIVVQGVADLVVMKPEEIWLLDYKTGPVGKGESTSRAAVYSPQLFLYARALEKIYRRKVTEIWICFLMAKDNVRLVPHA